MDNKQNILKISLDLFSSKGYDSVGIQEIVDKAGITKPTLYHYFGSKRGLLNAIVEKHLDEFIPAVENTAVYKHDLIKNLTDVANAFFTFAKHNPVFYRLFLTMSISSPESESTAAVNSYNLRIFKILEELFKQASTDHGNMKNRHNRYAFTFIGMLNNYIVLYLHSHIKFSDETLYQAVHQFSHGIYS